MYKKILLLILIIISILIRITIVIKILNLITKDNNIDDRYYYSEVFGDNYSFRNRTVYYKYYYKSKSDNFFKKRYNKVNKNKKVLKTYYDKFKNILKSMTKNKNGKINLDFFEEKINKDDYFILYDESGKEIKDTSNVNLSFYKYTIYYYDVKKNILYILKKY